MFETIFQYLGLIYARYIFRKEIDSTQSLNNFIDRSRNVLIILPIEYEDASIAGTAFKELKEKFKHLEITILTVGIRSTPLSEFPKSRVMRMSSSHINKFYLPRENLIQRILDKNYDITIDLNLDFVLYTAYISRASGAKIRIGLANKQTDAFYNIQFNVDRTKPKQEIYDLIVQYLKKF